MSEKEIHALDPKEFNLAINRINQFRIFDRLSAAFEKATNAKLPDALKRALRQLESSTAELSDEQKQQVIKRLNNLLVKINDTSESCNYFRTEEGLLGEVNPIMKEIKEKETDT